jgi:hypothetical protein
MKHTKGPWIILDADERRGPSGHILSARIAHEDGGAIADAYANCLVTTDEQCRANARLIAAAPDLLAALQDFHNRGDLICWSFDSDDEKERKRRVLAAIRKATGEAT